MKMMCRSDMYLLLFDIDGTILRFRKGLARKLFSKVMSELYGRNIPEDVIPRFAGMTDLHILRTMTESIGVSHDEMAENLPTIWQKMLAVFKEYCTPENINLMPGVDTLIKQLFDRDDTVLGLITGNFEENAYFKLSAHRLNKYFDFGAFGSDHENRNMLPELAVQRANKIHGEGCFGRHNTLIIGDTFRDIECAHKNSMKVLAVATGEFTFEELEGQSPELLMRDFKNTDLVINEIYNLLKK